LNPLIFVIAGVGGLWVVGRLSRQSPAHPVNAVPKAYGPGINEAPGGVYHEYDLTPIDQWLDSLTPGEETAQISGVMIAGEGGGEF
jgi:hypothetical protein